MKDTKIEWADDTVNPWWGCERVSPACAHCYAETLAARFHPGLWGPGSERRLRLDRAIGELEFIARRGEREGRVRRVFIASMSDVFEDRADLIEPRKRLWDALHRLDGKLTPMLLTKRPGVMAAWATTHGWPAGAWAGTTVEDQRRADERVPELLRIGAATLFLSMEPLLGPVNVASIFHTDGSVLKPLVGLRWAMTGQGLKLDPASVGPRIKWIIAGGESGPKARPMHPEWARSLRDQAVAAGVAFHFKQWGEWQNGSTLDGRPDIDRIILLDGRTGRYAQDFDAETRGRWGSLRPTMIARVGKHAAGRRLDDRTWDEVPTP